jgi:hypothetical protein
MREANPLSHGLCRSPFPSDGSSRNHEDGPLMVVKEERFSSADIYSLSVHRRVDMGGHRMDSITAKRLFR